MGTYWSESLTVSLFVKCNVNTIQPLSLLYILMLFILLPSKTHSYLALSKCLLVCMNLLYYHSSFLFCNYAWYFFLPLICDPSLSSLHFFLIFIDSLRMVQFIYLASSTTIITPKYYPHLWALSLSMRPYFQSSSLFFYLWNPGLLKLYISKTGSSYFSQSPSP